MPEEGHVSVSSDEIRESLKELQEQEDRLNRRLSKLANLLRNYGAYDGELTEEEQESRDALMEEIAVTLNAIRGCSKYQAQFGQLLK
ncbi:MAG: hypothetical protein ABIH23_11500 [bacterium]